MIIPGIIPAISSGPMGTCAIPPQRIPSAVGGRTMAKPLEARMEPAARSREYPASRISGSSVRENNAVLANDDPERSPKAPPPATATIGNRPGIPRISSEISAKAFWAIRERNNISPIRMNKGIAEKVKLLTELNTLRLTNLETAEKQQNTHN